MNEPTLRRRQRGFTLIELIIFIVVVSAGLAGILSVMNTVVKSSADPMVRKQSIAIAESLLEEILLKEWKDPIDGINGSTICTLATAMANNRGPWNDVCDYNGYTSTGILDLLGNPVAGLENYNISPVAVVTPGDGTAAATAYATDNPAMYGIGAKRITVSVTGPQGTISLTGYRANY